jgi:predicted DCC family thiol-disulfide oxidoreductase YuxK
VAIETETLRDRNTEVRPDAPVLLYDGVCGFCDATVQFIIERDRRAEMLFAPLQGPFAADVLGRHPELRGVDSLILVQRNSAGTEVVSARSEAVVRIGEYLGRGWGLARVLRIVPRFLRDAGYDLFARFRYRLFGRMDSCPIPAPEVRARFLP